ncbi:hypothetical protein KBP46_10130 [Chryseobacterium sp. PCH239]|uniref:hypothetical protein n=1 Tax=Chryseobacterium sp. PCH239 TaxID=2825845 RepID=UPI001C10A6B3|nr:hypothetical protein [Chryseobacterium sp. PCH239]QWT88154.1 hypothetical protein KBP46_10130 [Chryseobacterium sp. PCH239]
MEFKGTKGQWIIDENEDVITELKEVIGDIVCLKPEEYEESMENWKYNALLISKAPEMLEALITIRRRYNIQPDFEKEIDQLIKEATEI